MKIFTPTYYAKSIFDIDIIKLKKQGIKLVIFDLDNTLAPNNKWKPSARVKSVFRKCTTNGMKITIISNNSYKRVAKYCEKLGIFYTALALKPLPFKFLRIKKHFKDIQKEEMIMVGDQLLTDIAFANNNKIKSILVKPLHISADAKITTFNRKLEKKFLDKLIKNNELKSL